MLFHISEESGIGQFEPRPSEYTGEPVVWAIDAGRLRNYLVPRECPRVTFYAGPKTTSADVERFSWVEPGGRRSQKWLVGAAAILSIVLLPPAAWDVRMSRRVRPVTS